MKPTSTSSGISEGPFLLHQLPIGVAKEKPEIQSLYKGWQLLFSSLPEGPKILLGSFDPGGGFYSRHSEMVAEFQPWKPWNITSVTSL